MDQAVSEMSSRLNPPPIQDHSTRTKLDNLLRDYREIIMKWRENEETASLPLEWQRGVWENFSRGCLDAVDARNHELSWDQDFIELLINSPVETEFATTGERILNPVKRRAIVFQWANAESDTPNGGGALCQTVSA